MDALSVHSLLEIERRGWDSLIASKGGDFYGRLMTPDAVMVLVNGMVLDRDGVVESLNASPPWSSYELADERVVGLGAEAAALVYTARARRDHEPVGFVALMSSVYRIVSGEPRLALYQQTTITH
jgi:hypothetical protein